MVTKCDNMLHFQVSDTQDIVRKTQKPIDFLQTQYYHSIIKHEQRLPHRKGSIARCLSLTREWGKASAKAPHEPIPCALRKMFVGESQSLGVDPEKAEQMAV